MQNGLLVGSSRRRVVGVDWSQLHCTNEDPKHNVMNVHTNAIRCWITGVIYSRAERGGVLCILNFVITRTLVGLFECGLRVQNGSLKMSILFVKGLPFTWHMLWSYLLFYCAQTETAL
jgi:hypothetical protein